MILRRYGNSVQSVAPNFDSRALTEIGVRRDHKISHPAEVFFATHERVHGHELAVTAEGYVQDEVEQLLLADLEGRVLGLEQELSEDGVAPGRERARCRSPENAHRAEDGDPRG